MSRFLSQLLEAKEPMFSLALRQLEQDSGKKGIDINLGTEIQQKIKTKKIELGLDPRDTTAKEMYYSLLNKIEQDNSMLMKTIDVDSKTDIDEILQKCRKTVEDLQIPKSCWVLKKSVAKRLLKINPPKKIMNLLNYRSIDSMLKNENIAEIYGALRFVESPDWLENFNKNYKTLKPSDFETRIIEIIQMPEKRWQDVAKPFVKKKKHNITHVKELGVIIMLPTSEEKIPGLAITVLPLLLHYINEIRLYSSFFKLKQVQPDFGKIVCDTLNAKPPVIAKTEGHDIHWRVIQRYFGKLPKEKHPEIFEPHVQPEDLHWRRAEEILFDIDPNLSFWKEMDYVAMPEGKLPVSFNLMDVAVAYANDAHFEDRVFYHFRESLWNEIFARYMGEKNLEDQVLKQLDNDVISPEKLEVF